MIDFRSAAENQHRLSARATEACLGRLTTRWSRPGQPGVYLAVDSILGLARRLSSRPLGAQGGPRCLPRRLQGEVSSEKWTLASTFLGPSTLHEPKRTPIISLGVLKFLGLPGHRRPSSVSARLAARNPSTYVRDPSINVNRVIPTHTTKEVATQDNVVIEDSFCQEPTRGSSVTPTHTKRREEP